MTHTEREMARAEAQLRRAMASGDYAAMDAAADRYDKAEERLLIGADGADAMDAARRDAMRDMRERV